jgi:hypothetical protein
MLIIAPEYEINEPPPFEKPYRMNIGPPIMLDEIFRHL